MPLFNVHAVPIMDGAFRVVYRLLDDNPRLNDLAPIISARNVAEETQKGVHRAAETVQNASGVFGNIGANFELRRAGYAARLALDALVATIQMHDVSIGSAEIKRIANGNSFAEAAVACFNRGNAHFDEGQYDHAIADYDEAIGLSPDYINALIGRGVAHSATGNYDRAIADLDEAIRISPNLTLNPNLALAFSERGMAYDGKGEYGRAIADHDEAIRLNPKDAVCFLNRGRAHRNGGQYDRAISDYDEAIRLDPNFTKAIELRSTALAKKDDWQSGSLYNRGVNYIDQGEHDLAIADWSEAIRLNPKLEPAFIQRALAYTSMGEYDKAIADYDEVIRLNPERAEVFWARGNAFARNTETDRAIADYDEAIRLKPNFVQAIDSRARIAVWINKRESGPEGEPA